MDPLRIVARFKASASWTYYLDEQNSEVEGYAKLLRNAIAKYKVLAERLDPIQKCTGSKFLAEYMAHFQKRTQLAEAVIKALQDLQQDLRVLDKALQQEERRMKGLLKKEQEDNPDLEETKYSMDDIQISKSQMAAVNQGAKRVLNMLDDLDDTLDSLDALDVLESPVLDSCTRILSDMPDFNDVGYLSIEVDEDLAENVFDNAWGSV